MTLSTVMGASAADSVTRFNCAVWPTARIRLFGDSFADPNTLSGVDIGGTNGAGLVHPTRHRARPKAANAPTVERRTGPQKGPTLSRVMRFLVENIGIG